MRLANCIIHDIVNLCSLYTQGLNQYHQVVIRRVFKYLRGIITMVVL